MHLGVSAFSIYNTSSPEQIDYLFGNAGNRIVVTEVALLPGILASGVDLDHVVVVDGKPDGATHTLAEVEALTTADFDFRSEEHTSELQSLMRISYAVFCLKKKKR